MDSIIQTDKKCFLCGKVRGGWNSLHSHHIFGGTANRKKSEQYGLKVWLCGYDCHEYGPNAVHMNKQIDLMVKAEGQKKFEEVYGDRNLFRKEFGKSYL